MISQSTNYRFCCEFVCQKELVNKHVGASNFIEMKLLCRFLIILFPTVYIVATIFVAYRLFYGNYNRASVQVVQKTELDYERQSIPTSSPRKLPPIHVEVWGKAAISIYLWEHILKGELYEAQGGFVKEGHVTIEDITFTFRWGPGVIQSTVPGDVKNLVLILNGRSPGKISTAKQWLDYLPKYPKLQHSVVVLLGDEQCNNTWILPYIRSHGGLLDAVLIVYDCSLVDDKEFFQWPLGVATYRGFPDYGTKQDIDLSSPRSHLCNFLGTVYANSSRQTLAKLLDSPSLQDECIVRGREKWVPLETEESLSFYINSLLKSDLTLNPVGMNTECYRIYEALALGSIPVVENVVTPGICDNRSKNSPLRLLKKYNAPMILIKDWHDLPGVLHRESQRTLSEKVERRIAAVRWYADFKKSMRQEFIRILRRKIRN